jgi:hypothetical protein
VEKFALVLGNYRKGRTLRSRKDKQGGCHEDVQLTWHGIDCRLYGGGSGLA